MIDAAQFVEAARTRGFLRYAGVPCSYLTPFINYVIQDAALHYVSAANEGDAVAISAGVALAGQRAVTMMQNSGLGNAVSPLTSLTWTFQLPQLLIVTWRGEPGQADEPQHALMGPITPQMLETMDLAWELFPSNPEDVEAVLDRACAFMDRTHRPYVLVMKKGSVAPFKLVGSGAPAPRSEVPPRLLDASFHANTGSAASAVTPSSEAPMSRPAAISSSLSPSRTEALAKVIARTPLSNTVVLATTGFTGRELYALEDRANQLYMVGSMGCVATLALGLALARPDLRVIAVDGDGAALMRMGLFATLGAYGPNNLYHLLLDNSAHDSTGGQATVSAGVSFARIASACGYPWSEEGNDVGLIDRLLEGLDGGSHEQLPDAGEPSSGPRFARLLTRTGSPADLPRPSVTPVEVRARLQAHIGLTA